MSFAQAFTNQQLDTDGAQMKIEIDFETLHKLETAGATAKVIIMVLEQQHAAKEAERAPKRSGDRKRTAARRERIKSGQQRDNSVTEADPSVTLADSPRARLYREGTAAIMGMGRSERAARALIAGWLKQTHDDEQLVTATILRARDLGVADAAGWINATLKGKTNGTAKRSRSLATAGDDLIARAESFERENDLATDIEPEPSGTFGATTRR